jgi:hypothetical protein
MEEQRSCISCGEKAEFTLSMVLYRLGSSPKATVSTSAIGVCANCCLPSRPGSDGSNYRKLGACLAVITFGGRNDLWRKVQELAGGSAAAPDRKSAAAGGGE